jgi:hypothetical protein
MAGSDQKRRLLLSTTRFQDAGGPNGNYTPITGSLPPYYENYYNNKNNRNEWSAGFHHFEPYFAPPLSAVYGYNHVDCTFNIGGVNTEIDT